jgi:predicted NBD/HSP70 family sugar kinase
LTKFVSNGHDHAVTAQKLWATGLGGNARRIAEILRAHGPRTRAELATLTGLSRPTVSAGLADLATADLVEDGEVATGLVGRPAAVVRLRRDAGLAVGVDVGRRHIRVAVADLGHTVLIDDETGLDADAEEHPLDVLEKTVASIDAALGAIAARRDDVVGVGFGLPAPMTKDGRIGSPTLLPAWAKLAPGEELAARLRLPVAVDNDANLGALGEYVWGAGRGCADLVYVKLATGIGAGIVLDGRLYRGAAGTAGEIGHVTLDARGPVCRCGNRGCVELSAGGRALLEHARLSHPNLRDVAGLVDLATRGDAGCRRLLVDAAVQLGYALGGLVNLVNPELLILGGELGAATDLLIEPLRRGLNDTAMLAAVHAVKVVPSSLGDRSSVLGAVALALGVAPAVRQ